MSYFNLYFVCRIIDAIISRVDIGLRIRHPATTLDLSRLLTRVISGISDADDAARTPQEMRLRFLNGRDEFSQKGICSHAAIHACAPPLYSFIMIQ